MIYSLLIVALIAFLSTSVSAFSTGSGTCRAAAITDIPTSGSPSMAGASAGTNGFNFTSDVTSYTPGQKVTFTIGGIQSFTGFLAIVEKDANTPVGTFDVKTGTTITGNFPTACNNKATSITHDSPAVKAVPYTLTWTAPPSGTGAVTARVAVMISGRSFQFLNVALTEGGAVTSTTTAAPGTTTTTVAPKSSAFQSGPIAIIIGTMMALGLAFIKQF